MLHLAHDYQRDPYAQTHPLAYREPPGFTGAGQ